MKCGRCSSELPDGARFCPHCGQSVIDAKGPVPGRKKTSPLVLLLIVGSVGLGALMMCGIVAAIAIPNLLNAIDRGKQKRTMADIRAIGHAVESYAKEHGALPAAGDLDSLRPLLEPDFVRLIPPLDGWGQPWSVASGGEGYRIASPGKGGVFEGCGGERTGRFSADICFEDGRFTQWPEGAQY